MQIVYETTSVVGGFKTGISIDNYTKGLIAFAVFMHYSPCIYNLTKPFTEAVKTYQTNKFLSDKFNEIMLNIPFFTKIIVDMFKKKSKEDEEGPE